MKQRVLELLEELVAAHTLRAKQEKADEIAALVKTAVFMGDQPDEPLMIIDPSTVTLSEADLHYGALSRFSDESPLIPAEDHGPESGAETLTGGNPAHE